MFKKVFFYQVLAVCFAISLAACGSKVTAERFSEIQYEMTQDQVYAILGEPTHSSSINIAGLSGTIATWEDPGADTKITIQFFNERVKIKNLAKGQTP